MTCRTCRRLRAQLAERTRRILERARRIASKAAPAVETKTDAYGNEWTLVDGEPAVLRPPRSIDEDLEAEAWGKLKRRDVIRGLLAGAAIASGLARAELELVDVVERDFQRETITLRGVEIVWQQIVNGGQQPDLILVNPEIVRQVDPELYARIMENAHA